MLWFQWLTSDRYSKYLTVRKVKRFGVKELKTVRKIGHFIALHQAI